MFGWISTGKRVQHSAQQSLDVIISQSVHLAHSRHRVQLVVFSLLMLPSQKRLGVWIEVAPSSEVRS